MIKLIKILLSYSIVTLGMLSMSKIYADSNVAKFTLNNKTGTDCGVVISLKIINTDKAFYSYHNLNITSHFALDPHETKIVEVPKPSMNEPNEIERAKVKNATVAFWPIDTISHHSRRF